MEGGYRALACLVAFCLAVLLAATPVAAEQITVTDIAGRPVRLTVPVQRVVLGEGRHLHLVAALDRDAPLGRIVGWRDDLIKSDPDTYRAYLSRYPEIARLPQFGGLNEGGFSIEKAIALKPDLVLLNFEARSAGEETGLVEKLAALDIPVVYIDLRYSPSQNTEPSMRLLGRLFGKSEIAEELVAFRAAQIARVTERLAKAGDLARPLVMIDRIPGYSDECCMSFGPENFGKVVEMAGGRNLGSELLPGTFGTISPETIVARDPDVVIATGGNWDAFAPGGNWVGLGPGADLAEARRKLANLARRPAFINSRAVRSHRFYGIWHQFYNSPYQFIALQQIARWLHPKLFTDLDPDTTLRELHERFLPVPFQPGYWVELLARR
ncbi:ABC transporter substrate-binding protein [Bosea sp. Tri-44]|uniref:ABC transporter substrate-binding protein n=1 Tax=Bosea sp. Tri-44 TaxID=1972137 RepID=UPI00100EF5F6|nr:ABC transporter substrate-binding protein [Bosea sp. Tri-44]RXT56378.1 ABC transporter substrate-binding protein [Bosea sp. Tri-44]